MPPITGARTAPITLLPTPHSIQPSRRQHGLGFKAAQGLAKRMRKWQPGTRAASHEAFTLLRGEHETRMHKAARCRERIADTARQLYADAGRPPDPAQLAQLERDEAKLQDQTPVHASMRGVLLDRTVRAYLPDSDARQARQRGKALIKARQGPLGAQQPAGSALNALGQVLESATALEASARPVKALGREYTGGDGRIKLSAQTVHDLMTLLNSMKMLRRHDQDAGDFLYPAMKALHEANPGAAPGTGDTALLYLLRDLGGANRDDPRGLRAQLTRHGGGLDFWLANNSPPSHAQSPDAARQGLVDDVNGLLDGLASAGRQVWRETLQNHVPAWAGDVQAGLFQEAKVLYGSAQRWRDQGLARGTDEPILHASPAHAVGTLLERAANEALATPEAAGGDLAPLLGGLKSRLDQVAERIEQALKGAAAHTSPAESAALRQTLMQDVLEETGILGEIHRLRESDDAPAKVPSAAPPSAAHGSARGGTVPPAFRPGSGRLYPQVIQRMKRATADAKRQIIKLMSACEQAGDKPLSRHKLHALNNAYAGLVGLYGQSAPQEWQRLLAGEAMRLKNGELQNLNASALRAHVQGRANLTSKIEDPEARAASDKLLGDVWTAIRTASAKRNAGPFLKTWCASLSTPTSMADGTALFLQVEGLRDRIGKLDDGTVKLATLLNAAVEELSNAELSTLIAALAAPPVPGLATQRAAAITSAVSVTGVSNASAASALAAPAPASTAHQAPAARAAGAGTLQRLMRYLRGDFARPNEEGGTPTRQQTDTRTFLSQLYDAARAQAETRMESLRDSLVQDFSDTLFTQVGMLHAMLDTPDARAANGPVAPALEGLIRAAVQQGRWIHQYGEAAADTLAGTRFLRTAQGYDVVRNVTQPLGRATASLHARLDAGMKDVGIQHFRSNSAASTWRNTAVERIVQGTLIWEQMDYAVWRQAPRDIARPLDMPNLSGIGLRASLRRGGTRASTTSTQSVDREGFAKPKSIFNRAATTAAPAVAEDREASDGARVATPARPVSPAGSDDDDRASTVISDDSGFDEYGGSQLTLDSLPSDTPRHPAPPAKDAPAPPSPDTRIAGAVDSRLVAALRAALEQRNRGQWNRA